MAEIIRMPEVLAGTAEAVIQTWLVEVGTSVAANQSIAEIETDKAVVDLSAEVAGTIGRLLAPEGESVAVGDPILVMLAEGDGEAAVDALLAAGGVVVPDAGAPGPAADRSAVGPEPDLARASATASAMEPAPALSKSPVPSSSEARGRRIFASPLVRRLAAQHGVELAAVPGSGPNGRIVRRDLERYLEQRGGATEENSVPKAARIVPSTPTEPEATASGAKYEDVPLDGMRRTIARRLTESKSTVPHFYLVAECHVDELLALRGRINQSTPRKISINDFVLKAVATALVEVPAANAIWNEESIRRFSSVDISVAVATNGGLTTPVLRSVERMSLTSVSAAVAEFAERARIGRLKQHELEGGSFSVSNLGMYGTAEFSAILNPPQAGILAVGAARQQPVVTSDGELGVGTVMTVTLSADHRVLDGAAAAEWLAAFQRLIENPLTILV
jgi:pyruvate dehydrogenase E2 component (dihydrolipoamide acetyltransferase)